MSDTLARFAKLLTQTCTIMRQAVGTGSDDDLVLGTATTVAADVPCLFEALRASADLLAVGSLQSDVQQLFLLPDADCQRRDVVTDEAGVEWLVDGVPQVFQARGVAHHLEVLVTRKAVQ